MEELWEKGGFESPNVSYAVNSQNGDTYLVIEDNSTIYRLINKEGLIYVIAGFRLKKTRSKDFLNGTPFYNIKDPVLHIVLCSKVDERDRYAIELAEEYL